MKCPPLIELSQYLDDELDPPLRAAVAGHVGGCADCGRSIEQLLRIAVHRDPARSETATAACPSAEILLTFALSGSSGVADVDRHIDDCDPCLSTLQRLHRSVAMIPDMAVPVPARVRAQAGVPVPQPVAPARQPIETRPSLGERLAAWLRYPVLAPAAFAAGVLLYFAALQMPVPGLPASASRSVPQPLPVTRRVSVPEARVYTEPSLRADVVTKLGRGAAVEVSIVERGWYRVALADGRIGWIEGQSLQ